MTKHRIVIRAMVALALLLIVSSSASAQATRTWVSGVGDDVNPCSRTAPCKTFAGAISKTAIGGEIDAIDPGGFGTVTITKALTIDGSSGTFASILAAGTTGVTVNAGVNDIVTIRNLSINGAGTGIHGIRFIAGKALHIENCVIFNFSQRGVDFAPTTTSNLFIKDTVIRNNNNATNGGGIKIAPAAAINAVASLDGVRLEGNAFGLLAADRVKVTVRNSEAFGNLGFGFIAGGSVGPTDLNLESCVVANNTSTGIANGVNSLTSIIRITNCTVFNNNRGLTTSGVGVIRSFGNNRIDGNTVADGVPTTTKAQE